MGIRVIPAVSTLVFLLSPLAVGGTLGPVCDSCFGGVYTLDYFEKEVDGIGNDTYTLTFTLDLSGFNGPATVSTVNNLAVKAVSGPNFVSATTISAPTGVLGDWTQTGGNLNSNGCTGSGAGWVCLSYTGALGGDPILVNTDTLYSWTFDLEVKAGTLMGIGSIQANFEPATGVLLSEKIAVSEGFPAELPIMLSGLAVYAFLRRKEHHT